MRIGRLRLHITRIASMPMSPALGVSQTMPEVSACGVVREARFQTGI